MTPRVDGMQGNFDNPKRIIHTLTDEEKKAGSVFTRKVGPNQTHKAITSSYKDLNGDGMISEDELQSVKIDQYDKVNSRILQTEFHKDVNNNDGLELFIVDKYHYNNDGTVTVNRYKDKNGDGYSDEYTKYEYDKNVNLTSKVTTAEENKINRSMEALVESLQDYQTKEFINNLMPKILQIPSQMKPDTREGFTQQLVELMQEYNGSIKNNLSDLVKEVGTPEQIKVYNGRIEEKQKMILNAARFAGIEVMQNPDTKLYQLKIGQEIIDVPERNVSLVSHDTMDRVELVPGIVDY